MDSEIRSEQLYKHVTLRPGEFRIALLQPAINTQDPVVCELVSSGHFTEEYEVIPYTRPDPIFSNDEILLSDGSNQYRRQVPTNLHGGLQLCGSRIKYGLCGLTLYASIWMINKSARSKFV
jgi:hypothetical protein